MNWKIGQTVVIVTARHNGEIKIEDATITKVGRKWVTVGEGWQEQRFDFEGLSDRDWGHRPRMWPSRAAFEAEQDRRAAWRELISQTKASYPPKHLSIDDIRAVIATLSKDTPQ